MENEKLAEFRILAPGFRPLPAPTTDADTELFRRNFLGGLGSGSTPPKKLRLNSSVSASVVGAGSGLNPGASILNSASFSFSIDRWEVR
jgi:hypothetical protein